MTESVLDFTAVGNALLEEFRGFGGRAENVMQRDGPLGLGLFPIEPCQPIDLRVPRSLLVPADNVKLRKFNWDLTSTPGSRWVSVSPSSCATAGNWLR